LTTVRIAGRIFHVRKLMLHRPVGSNVIGCSNRADAVIGFFGCVHRSSNSQCFSMGQTTPKMHFRLVGSGPHLIHGFLGPRESTPPKRHLDQFCRLCTVHQYDQRTDRQTVHATCDIFRSRPHLCYACDAT